MCWTALYWSLLYCAGAGAHLHRAHEGGGVGLPEPHKVARARPKLLLQRLLPPRVTESESRRDATESDRE
eukprot:2798125-Pyramimonas_sp.AAC.1